MRLDDLEARFAARRAQGLRRNLEITHEGLLLGAGTLLAGLALAGEEARILALLSAAFACAVSPQILDILGKAIALWKGGEKFRAQLHLTCARLPPLTEEQAFALCAADELLKEGMTPRALMKGLGLDPAPLDALEKYAPDQPRVPAGSGRASGRWGSGGGASGAPPKLIGHGQVLSEISVEPAGPTVQVAQSASDAPIGFSPDGTPIAPIASEDDPQGLKAARAAALAAGLTTKEEKRAFHDLITGQGITDFQELVELAKSVKKSP